MDLPDGAPQVDQTASELPTQPIDIRQLITDQQSEAGRRD